MATYVITCRTMGPSPCGHRHVESVGYRVEGSNQSRRATRQDMVAALQSGDSAYTWSSDGSSQWVYPKRCTGTSVYYLTTRPDATTVDNLDDLDNC